MEDHLKARGDKFRAAAGKAAKPPEWRSALELPTEFVVREARAADLMIVGGIRHPVLRDPYRCVDPGAVLLRAGRPILLVPPGVTSLAGKRIAIVEFCEPGGDASAQHHLEDVTQFLRRHGVSTACERVRPIDVTVTSSLFRFVQDDAFDLIVAGGYGHTRLGEWIFGGVTHDLLTNSPVCCLLSH
jgi:nucleotide-binding universal stress UspA family protein